MTNHDVRVIPRSIAINHLFRFICWLGWIRSCHQIEVMPLAVGLFFSLLIHPPPPPLTSQSMTSDKRRATQCGTGFNSPVVWEKRSIILAVLQSSSQFVGLRFRSNDWTPVPVGVDSHFPSLPTLASIAPIGRRRKPCDRINWIGREHRPGVAVALSGPLAIGK